MEPVRQVTFLLSGPAYKVFATLRACKGIHGSFYRVVPGPPYWGLRGYKLEPSVWDGVEGCQHDSGN